MRSIFVGDSHTCGYDNKQFWQSNNYAEIYSELNQKPVAIYAMPGCSNQKYVTFIKTLLDYYDDVDEVFIQFTYWTRYLLATNVSEDWFINGLQTNHFAIGPNRYSLTDRWTDDTIIETDALYTEYNMHVKTEHYEPFKGRTMGGPEENENFYYTNLWHNQLTHLKYRQVCSDLFIIDRLCQQRNIPWYLFSMNDRVFIPENFDYFGPLTNYKSDNKMHVEQWFSNTIQEYKIDEEHYNYDFHYKIAKNYIPYLKEQDER
jgi:hypothetical protein